LLGDALLRSLESDIRRQISTATTTGDPAYTTLAAVGITTTKEGTLKIDEAKLSAALTADFDAVGRLFASTDGVTARLGKTLDTALASDAQIASRTTSNQDRRRVLERDVANLDRRMAIVEARYRAQFTALDTALAGLQSTANFLTQQLTNRSVR
jgi:flagellar hook-associated protein 2